MRKSSTDVIAESFPEGLWFLLWYEEHAEWVPIFSQEYLQSRGTRQVQGPFVSLEDALAARESLAMPAVSPSALESPATLNHSGAGAAHAGQEKAENDIVGKTELTVMARRSRQLLDEINNVNYRNTPPGNRRRTERRHQERRRAPRGLHFAHAQPEPRPEPRQEPPAEQSPEQQQEQRKSRERRALDRRLSVDERLRLLVEEFHELMAKRTFLQGPPPRNSRRNNS